MARFLFQVQDLGVKTSVDDVRDSSADYKKKNVPLLKIPKKRLKEASVQEMHSVPDAFTEFIITFWKNKSLNLLRLLQHAIYSANSFDGMLSRNEILKLPQKYGRLQL